MKLEGLLKLKIWKEDEAKNRFAVLLKELAVEERRLHELENQYSFTTKKLECTDEMVNIDEIKRLNEHLEHLLFRIHRQRGVIAKKEREVEEARRLFVEASKEKRIFEKLDERHKSALKREHKRKEQIGTDEHAVTGHHRRKGS